MALSEKWELVSRKLTVKTGNDGKRLFYRKISVASREIPDYSPVEGITDFIIGQGEVAELCESDGSEPDPNCVSELIAAETVSITQKYNSKRRTLIYEQCPEASAFSIDGTRIWFEDDGGMRYYIAEKLSFPFALKNQYGRMLYLRTDKYVNKLIEES